MPSDGRVYSHASSSASLPALAGPGVDIAQVRRVPEDAPRPLDYPLYWRVRVIHPEWFGRRCRIVIHGGKGNRLIEFDNGDRVVCPGQYLRRAR